MAPRETPADLAARLCLPAAPWLALLARCGVLDSEAWVAAGEERLARLGAGPGSDSLRWGLWLPLYSRVCQAVAHGERQVIGLNGPIGSGKSTLVAVLRHWATAEGLPLAVASIDDTYHGWEQRQALLAGNPFGVWRGPPGSHDVALLQERLLHWQAGGELALPRFDKRLRQGQGDRSGGWHGEPQVLLLEGWLLGCRSLPAEELAASLASLQGEQEALPYGLRLRPQELAWLPLWNQRLQLYERLWERLAALWVLRPSSWQWPRRWRLQAEAHQRRRFRDAAGGDLVSPPDQDPGALAGGDLDRLVRACLLSLPPQLYQDPLIAGPGSGPNGTKTEGLALLDSRRGCRWSGLAEHFSAHRWQG